jgi:hypothetical protein
VRQQPSPAQRCSQPPCPPPPPLPPHEHVATMQVFVVQNNKAGQHYLASVVSALHADQGEAAKAERIRSWISSDSWTFAVEGVFLQVGSGPVPPHVGRMSCLVMGKGGWGGVLCGP